MSKTRISSIALACVVIATVAVFLRLEIGKPLVLNIDRITRTTATGFNNCVSVEGRHVANMYTESLNDFRTEFQVDKLEALAVDDSTVLITDSRVGKDWLRYTPCDSCASALRKGGWRTEYQAYFRPIPQPTKLVGSTWKRIGNLSLRHSANIRFWSMLPGNRLQFLEHSVTASGGSSDREVKRAWEAAPPSGNNGSSIRIHSNFDPALSSESVILWLNATEDRLIHNLRSAQGGRVEYQRITE